MFNDYYRAPVSLDAAEDNEGWVIKPHQYMDVESS